MRWKFMRVGGGLITLQLMFCNFLTTRKCTIHTPYGGQYRRDIGGFLRII